MGIKSLFGFGQARDKPVRNYSNGEYSFDFGRSTSGKSVNEMTAMKTTAVYGANLMINQMNLKNDIKYFNNRLILWKIGYNISKSSNVFRVETRKSCAGYGTG